MKLVDVADDLLKGRRVDELLEMDLVRTMILVKQVYSGLFRPHGIETFEWHVLLRLAETDGPTQTELGARLLRDKVAITRLVAGLVEKGLIVRRADARDGRVQRVYLTSRARRLVPELLAIRDRVDEVVTAELSASERAALRRGMAKLEDGYRRWQRGHAGGEPARRIG